MPASKIIDNCNLGKTADQFDFINPVFTPGALPSTPSAGTLAIDSGASNQFKWYDGSSWQTASGSTHNLLSATHPDTTAGAVARGDLITGQGASTKWAKLAIGAANTIPKSDGTDISWGNIVNANIDASAAIAYSKLNLATSILNADISASAAIVDTKLAQLTTANKVHTDTLTTGSHTQGQILYNNGTKWLALAVGTSGQSLLTQGAGANPVWGTPTIASASALAISTTIDGGATGDVILTTTTQTVGNANLTIPDYAGVNQTLATLELAQVFTGNKTFTNTGLLIRDTDASHTLNLKCNSNLTANRTLNFVPGDVDRSITLAGNINIAADLITSGANSLTLTTTGATNVTLPTTGTLATLAGAEVLSSKTFTLPEINDTSADHQYVFAVSELAADRTITLPLLTGNDVFVFADFIQTLTNKTLSGNVATGFVYSAGGNAITFQNVVHTVIGRDTTDTLTNKSINANGTGNAITNLEGNDFKTVTGTGAAEHTGMGIMRFTLSNQAAAVNIWTTNAPYKFKIVKAWSISTSADGGTWKLNNGTLGGGTDITNAVSVAASADDFDEPTDYTNSASTINANGSLSVVPDGAGLLDCEIYLMVMPLS